MPRVEPDGTHEKGGRKQIARQKGGRKKMEKKRRGRSKREREVEREKVIARSVSA